MKKNLIIMLICTVTIVIAASCGSNTKAKIERCIEEGDFVRAKQLNKKLEFGGSKGMKLKICKAEVSALIDKGQFDLAADIAKEDVDYGVYYEVLMGKLVQVYENDSQGLIIALASINFPKPRSSGNWNGSFETFYPNDLNMRYGTFNENIKQLLLYAKTKNDISFVQTVAAFLRPLYKEVKKPDKSFGPYYEDTPTDYTQANQIKKELGVK